MKVKVFLVNAFAKMDEGGNPAGVVLDAEGLQEEDMKKIAKIVGFSETAFVSNSDVADFKVRFFTPVEEVDLCGHATIALFHTLAEQERIDPAIYTQETKAGVLQVAVKKDRTIMMNQNLPQFFEAVNKEKIADSLNLKLTDIMEELPTQIVSTGLRDIIVPIKKREVLNAIKPDLNKIIDVSRKYNTIGYHLFTLESLGKAYVHTRNFAPLYGIPEESATGTSNGALASYLFKYDKYNNKKESQLIVEQGYSMLKPSEIIVELETQEKNINGVKVGGKAISFSEIEVSI
ncbi:PhzF family phenazine biosynthesis protein [Eubacteriaceae bacterium ES2]|nr:PhzF family phenazine biosynthesis protein [Eubacteriaceae bacterium ES2]